MATTMNQEFTKKVMEYLNYGWEFCTQARIGNVGEHTAVLLEQEGRFVVVFYRVRTQLNSQATEYITRYDIGVGTPDEFFKGMSGDVCTIDKLRNTTVWTYILEDGDYRFVYVTAQGMSNLTIPR